MATDLTAITYFAPIAAFLLVFLVSFAILWKTKLLGESYFINIFISFIISILFISAGGAITYIKTITPWIAILLITLTFILAMIGFIGKEAESLTKPVGIIFIILAGIVFLISAFLIFSNLIVGYLPGPFFGQGEPQTIFLLSWLYSPHIAGAILLIIISAIVAYVLVKAK